MFYCSTLPVPHVVNSRVISATSIKCREDVKNANTFDGGYCKEESHSWDWWWYLALVARYIANWNYLTKRCMYSATRCCNGLFPGNVFKFYRNTYARRYCIHTAVIYKFVGLQYKGCICTPRINDYFTRPREHSPPVSPAFDMNFVPEERVCERFRVRVPTPPKTPELHFTLLMWCVQRISWFLVGRYSPKRTHITLPRIVMYQYGRK